MNRRQFEKVVERAVSTIPEVFLAKVENLSFQVEMWADPGILRELGFDDPRDLLGFYQGCPLPERSFEFAPPLPDVIIVFQGAVENHVRETGDPLVKVVRETILHELAHYFGFTEEEMEDIEARWAGKEAP